jgi:bacillolysin
MAHLQHPDNLTNIRQLRLRTLAAATILLLFGCLPVAAQPNNRQTVAALDASTLREWDNVVERELRAGDLRRYDSQPNLYLPGLESERFAQYHEGVPVYGADLLRQTDAGVTTAILGTLFTGIDLDTTPGLTLSAARAAFDEMAGPPFGLTATPSLWVFPLGEGAYTLAWRGTLSGFRDVFIDAGTGETLFEVSRVRHQTVGVGTGLLGDQRKMATESIGATFRTRDPLRPAVIGTFDMEYDENRFLNTLLALFGGAPPSLADLAADADNVWEDGIVVDVHPGVGWSYDYLATQLGWAGIDGRDGAITAFVHPVNPARVLAAADQCFENATDPFECIQYVLLTIFIDNALYIQPFPGVANSTGFMVFGEPHFFPTPLTALDIVAHEMAHGVTHFTAELGDTLPPNEPGAINEAFSDIIGTATEFYVEEPGDGPLRADYLVGEDTGFPIRSLRDPQELQNGLTGPYPDHYDNLFRGPEDQGGVHVNSTILSHAYFLAVDGGTNRTSGLGVTGVGHENRLQIERIFFNAWVNLVPSFADHAIVGESLIRSATDLFGSDAPATRAIWEALDAVGIPRAASQMYPLNQSCHDSGDCQ